MTSARWLAVGAVLAALALWFFVGARWRAEGRGAAFAEADRPELALGRSEKYDYDPPAPGSYRLPAFGPAGDGDVLATDGEPRRLREILEDRITVLSFIYTRCADPSACPLATGVLRKVHDVSKQDPRIADNLQLVTFSFDPDHDTPEVMERYGELARKGAGSDWHFVTTRDADDLAPILAAYGQQVDRKKDADDPLGPFYHMLRVYLIDRRGVIRNVYSTGLLDPRLVVTDVRTLLLEERSPAE